MIINTTSRRACSFDFPSAVWSSPLSPQRSDAVMRPSMTVVHSFGLIASSVVLSSPPEAVVIIMFPVVPITVSVLYSSSTSSVDSLLPSLSLSSSVSKSGLSSPNTNVPSESSDPSDSLSTSPVRYIWFIIFSSSSISSSISSTFTFCTFVSLEIVIKIFAFGLRFSFFFFAIFSSAL